ncbi:MAG: hypothetical protein IPK76_16540 [Lewinellaceae bacterium]|nr:hypothetical protein [Lewinellaceae bacterium]
MKHLLWFSGFLMLLLAGDRLGGVLLQRQADASLFRYSRLYRGEAGADLLFVGNSRGLTFYQPFIEEKTGLRTFNMSYNGLPADLARVLVQDYLDRYPAPKKNDRGHHFVRSFKRRPDCGFSAFYRPVVSSGQPDTQQVA